MWKGKCACYTCDWTNRKAWTWSEVMVFKQCVTSLWDWLPVTKLCKWASSESSGKENSFEWISPNWFKWTFLKLTSPEIHVFSAASNGILTRGDSPSSSGVSIVDGNEISPNSKEVNRTYLMAFSSQSMSQGGCWYHFGWQVPPYIFWKLRTCILWKSLGAMSTK